MIIVAFGNLRRRLHGRAEPRDKEVFMYLSEFIESLALYGLPAVVMSVLAEGCTLLLVRLCRIQNTALKNILPFLFGVAFSCLYNLIFQGAGSVFTEETLYTGILCGSLSTVYGAILNRTLSKKAEPDRESIVIGQLNGFVRPEELSDTAKAICAALEEGADEQAIAAIIAAHGTEAADDETARRLAAFLLAAVEALKEE